MVPGGTYQAQSMLIFARQNTSRRIANCPSGKLCHVDGPGRDHRVGIRTASAGVGKRLKCRQVLGLMHVGDLGGVERFPFWPQAGC